MNIRKHRIFFSFLLVSFFLLLVILPACEQPEAPEFRNIANFKIDLVNQDTAKINADVVFFNPNSKKIEIKDVLVDVSVDDKQVTSLERNYNITAEPNQEFSIPLDIALSLKDLNMNLLSTAFSMLSGETKKVRYKGQAKVKVYGFNFNVPFDEEQEIKIKL